MSAQEELTRLRELQVNGWNDLRSPSQYRLVTLEFPFGQRSIFVVPDEKRSMYEDLQSSRGIVNDDTVESVIERHTCLGLSNADFDRIHELVKFINLLTIDTGEFFELGFRFPHVLKYYSTVFKTVKGCDVASLSVEVGKTLGYDVKKCNLNDQVPEVSNSNVVVAYHVLEHISRPDLTIKMLFNKMKPGSYFHVEVPIEPGTPRIRYAHMFPFEYGDIKKMCKLAGFQTVNRCTDPYDKGPEIERVLVKKV